MSSARLTTGTLSASSLGMAFGFVGTAAASACITRGSLAGSTSIFTAHGFPVTLRRASSIRATRSGFATDSFA